jgi:glycosyltransferase involved in cell wall biosynthesis
MNQPLVSVFTCVYNMADKIHRVFQSLQAQTYKNIEHIIIDDGSTDHLAELVEPYRESCDYPVIFIQKENGGKHTATNVAWNIARGKYIVQLDADDELLPHAIKYLVHLWTKIPEADKDQYWCVQGRCKDQISGKLDGDLYPKHINYLSARKAQLCANKVRGEKIGLMRSSILKDYRYPEPEGVTFVPESVLWKPLNQQYRTWYSNEIVRIYYINEGDTLSKPRKTRQVLANYCWSAKWRILHRHAYACNFIKELLKYCICWHLAIPYYRKRNPLLRDFMKKASMDKDYLNKDYLKKDLNKDLNKDFAALIGVLLLWLPTWFASYILKYVWNIG